MKLAQTTNCFHQSLAWREEKAAPGYKRVKERLSVMACVKITYGYRKISPSMSHKNISPHTIPVYYAN